MSKEQFIEAHEELISEAMDSDPLLTYERAYDICADKAYDRSQEMWCDYADYLSDMERDEQCSQHNKTNT
jgi:hypothetical protein